MWFGFINFCNLMIVIIMLIPNIIYGIKAKNIEYKKVNRIVVVMEQIGRYSSMVFMVLPVGMHEFGFPSVAEMFIYLFCNVILLVLYMVTWVLYFKKRSLIKAMVLAFVPTLIFMVTGIALRHVFLIIAAVVFGITHSYITYQNNRN